MYSKSSPYDSPRSDIILPNNWLRLSFHTVSTLSGHSTRAETLATREFPKIGYAILANSRDIWVRTAKKRNVIFVPTADLVIIRHQKIRANVTYFTPLD